MINNVNNRQPEPIERPEPVAPPPPPPPAPVAPTGYPGQDGFDAAGAQGPELAPEANGAPEATGKGAADAKLNADLKNYDTLSAEDKARFDDVTKGGGPAADNARKLLADGKFGDYAAVEKAIEAVGAPLEKEDLRRALGNGRLDAGVLETMKPLAADGKTALGYDRHQLLCQLAQDLGRPEELMQRGNQADCGGLAAEYVLSKSNPSAFTKAVVELAEKGSTMLGSAKLVAPPADGSDARGPTQRIFAQSFVETAAGKTPLTNALVGGLPGIDAEQMKTAMGQMLGGAREALYLAEPKKGQGSQADALETQLAAEQVLRDAAAAGQPVLANRQNGHWMAVTGVDGTGPDATVHFADITGGNMSCKMSDFVKELDSLVFDPSVSQPSTLGNRSWKDPGGGGNQGATTTGTDDYL